MFRNLKLTHSGMSSENMGWSVENIPLGLVAFGLLIVGSPCFFDQVLGQFFFCLHP